MSFAVLKEDQTMSNRAILIAYCTSLFEWWLYNHSSQTYQTLLIPRSDGSAVPVSAASVEEASNRSLRLLHIVQHFFTHHMIDVFSCDFSSSGLEQAFVESKLKSFFSKKTEDGPRFDTYVLYYSGHVYPNGNWALTGKNNMSIFRH